MRYKSFPELAAAVFQPSFPQREDRGRFRSSEYITMRDGVKIAIDVTLPADLKPGEKIPAILQQTRYHRRKVFRRGLGWLRKYLVRDFEIPEHGYANVYVDVRGTGASFGSHPYFLCPEERRDMSDILDWIVAQPWSDGRVMTIGVSYPGMTAEVAGTSNHPALRGLLPMEVSWDLYGDLNPGGIRIDGVTKKWSNLAESLDQNDTRAISFLYWLLLRGVTPVDSDSNGALMQEAILDHKDNERPFEYDQHIEYRDDPYGPTGVTTDVSSMFNLFRAGPSEIPVYLWGSWYDAGTANVVINHFLNWNVPFVGVIGSWAHTIVHDGSPYNSGKTEANPPRDIMFNEFYRFFDYCRKGNPSPPKQILYYTIGEEVWRSSPVWPPEGHLLKRWFLGENHGLSEEAPQGDVGSDHYEVNFTATSGTKSRWFTLVSQPVEYKNRDREDKKLLTYETPPFTVDFEMTGHPIANIYLSSTHEDGCLIVYIEDIDTEGSVYYLTEGAIRFMNRKVIDKPFYKSIGPQHSLLRSDAAPMVPGEVTEITFALLPISAMIRKRHRLRVAFAGADHDNFSRYPKTGVPRLEFMRNATYPSSIDIPVVQQYQ
ncbi:MAG: CocE/NonD family hydrolase [Candidatus Thorarchaeota archaeon]